MGGWEDGRMCWSWEFDWRVPILDFGEEWMAFLKVY